MTTTSTPKPADHLARQQATEALSVSMAVNAGAGSGKTSVLTKRIVGLLSSGTVEPRELCAITFTEKAAGELLARVKDELEAALTGANDAGDVDESKRLSQALDRFSEMTLTTIHAFCRDLLRHESLEAGFAPDTEIGDESITDELLRRAVQSWLAELRERRPEMWRLVERLVTSHGLREAARSLYRYRDYDDVAAAEPLDGERARGQLAALLAAVDAAGTKCTDDEDALVVKNAALVDVVRAAVAHASALDGVLEVLLSGAQGFVKAGRKESWGGKQNGAENKEAYGAAIQGFLAWRETWLEVVHGEIVRELRAHVLDALDREKREQSVASFDDLLREAAALLRDRPGARERLSRRYRVVLIDEVQDTDPVQAEVATRLTRALADDGPWHQSPPEPGRLFAVGDPKQSIYRFRGADVRTFSVLEELIQKNGRRASLVQNFRSVPGIVSWVNHVFAGLDGFEPQVAHRAPAALDPVVLLQATDDVGEIEAVVRHLHRLFAQHADVVDRATNALRPLRPDDVMLLLPTWTKADAIADALRASGLECVVEGGDTFFGRDEVRLALAALRAIAEPADTEATVFVLRGLFGLSLVELAEHKKQGGGFRSTVPNAPPSKAAAALAVLSKLHRGRGHTSLAGLLDELFEETRALAVWSLLPDGESRLANIDKLKSMVRAIEGETTSPLAVVDELLRVEANVKDKDIDRIDDDGDAVRVTTFFKAKGLEAPVVILLEAHRRPDPPAFIVDHEARTVAVKLSKLVPPGWKELCEVEERHRLEERRRFTYVAATRARDQLVICRPAKVERGDPPVRKRRPGCLLGHDIEPRGLPDVDEVEHDAVVVVAKDAASPAVRTLLADELPAVVRPFESFPGLDAQVDALLAASGAGGAPAGDPEGDARAATMKSLLRDATRGCVRWRAATSDAGSTKWTPGVPVDESAAEESVGARGGRVIHAVMERLDLSRPHAELSPLAAELVQILGAQAGLFEEKIAACRTIVERILQNEHIEKARRAPERWHEVPFTYSKRPGAVVSGTIDLCFPVDAERKKWIVFDWKSKVPPRESPLHARYQEQLKEYARALLASLGPGIEVTETLIIGPHPELGDVLAPEDALGDVRGDLRAPLAALIERGVSVPKVGFDVGEPAVSVELFWEDAKLVVDPALAGADAAALEAQGFAVHRALGEDVAVLLGAQPASLEDG